MKRHPLHYPPAEDVDAADVEVLRYWLNHLPGSPHDADWAIMQRIINRLAKSARKLPAKPLQAAENPKPKPKPKPAPVAEAVPEGYFKSLFS